MIPLTHIVSADISRRSRDFFSFVISLLTDFGCDRVDEVGVGQVRCEITQNAHVHEKDQRYLAKVTKGVKLMDCI